MIRSLETESEILGIACVLRKSWQEGNARAISFYEKVGFRFDGVKKNGQFRWGTYREPHGVVAAGLKELFLVRGKSIPEYRC